MKKGYKHVYRFTGGNAEWRSFNYPQVRNNKYRSIKPKKLRPEQVHELMAKHPDLFLLDVRPENYFKGPNFIKGTINIPLLTITDRIDELPKDRPIVITDWTMRQSPLAAKYLQAQGLQLLGVLKGGLVRWEAEGYPVEIRKTSKDRQ